jgi:hypothetical protein
MSRQQPIALLTPPGRLDNLIDHRPRERRGQYPQRDPITEPLTRLDPHLPSSWHERRIPAM